MWPLFLSYISSLRRFLHLIFIFFISLFDYISFSHFTVHFKQCSPLPLYFVSPMHDPLIRNRNVSSLRLLPTEFLVFSRLLLVEPPRLLSRSFGSIPSVWPRSTPSRYCPSHYFVDVLSRVPRRTSMRISWSAVRVPWPSRLISWSAWIPPRSPLSTFLLLITSVFGLMTWRPASRTWRPRAWDSPLVAFVLELLATMSASFTLRYVLLRLWLISRRVMRRPPSAVRASSLSSSRLLRKSLITTTSCKRPFWTVLLAHLLYFWSLCSLHLFLHIYFVFSVLKVFLST